MRLLRTPKVQMAIVLSALSLIPIFYFPTSSLIIRLITLILFTLILEYVLWQVRKVSPFVPSAAIVTALIIFLLAHPLAPIWQPLLACAVAVISKQFLRPGIPEGAPSGHHIFNPAALGLIATSLLGLPISWWGTISGDPLYTTLLVVGAGFVIFRTLNQTPIVTSFLLTILVIVSIINGPATAINQIVVAPFLFFALVMLPEPMTAAKFPKTKLIYGALVGVLSFVSPLFVPFGIDPLLGSLLLGNGIIRFIEDKRWVK